MNGATYSRATAGTKLDYKWREETTVSFNSFFNYFHGNNDDHWWDLTTTNAVATVDAAGNRTGPACLRMIGSELGAARAIFQGG